MVLVFVAALDENCAMTENIMAQIPGEYLSPARYWLPHPETASDSTHQVQCRLPRFGTVQITFTRMTHRRGRMRIWFWTPERVELSTDPYRPVR